MNQRQKVYILSGGPSDEHEVSLSSGKGVFENLNREFYEPKLMIIGKNGEWPVEPELLKEKADIAFIAMHGKYGEDGTIQSLLDSLGVSYTGSLAPASALGMNKFFSGMAFKRRGLEIPLTLLFSKSDWRHNPAAVIKKIMLNMHKPWVIKPNRGGSSIGVSVSHKPDQLALNIADLFLKTDEAIIQPFIRGKEIACGVLDHGLTDSTYSLAPLEIIPAQNREFDDYNSKYSEIGGSLALAPTGLSNSLLEAVRRVAVMAHKAIGARGMSRIDMIAGNDGKIYILEINTIPGFTKTSLLPKSAQAHGINFSELLERIIKAALNEKTHPIDKTEKMCII